MYCAESAESQISVFVMCQYPCTAGFSDELASVAAKRVPHMHHKLLLKKQQKQRKVNMDFRVLMYTSKVLDLGEMRLSARYQVLTLLSIALKT